MRKFYESKNEIDIELSAASHGSVQHSLDIYGSHFDTVSEVFQSHGA